MKKKKKKKKHYKESVESFPKEKRRKTYSSLQIKYTSMYVYFPQCIFFLCNNDNSSERPLGFKNISFYTEPDARSLLL